MRTLLGFAERRDVQELVGRVVESEMVQGVVVDYDPLWLGLWRLHTQVSGEAFNRLAERLILQGRVPPAWELMLRSSTAEFAPPDPDWRPPWWDEIRHFVGRQRWAGDGPPFVVKVCLLPPQPRRDERLPELGEYPFEVVFERRAVAELAMPLRQHRPVVGGVSIGAGAKHAGTLGGVVEDQHGERWGVSCAHVVDGTTGIDQPAQRDGSAGPIGYARYLSQLQPSTAGGPCNPYHPSSVLNTVDATLIEFNGTSADLEVLHCGTLSGVTAKQNLNPGTLVEMAGKVSGTRTLEVGGLGVVYRLRDPRTKALHCFHHLFELRWPQFWRLLGGRPVQRGDSGAWALASGAGGQEWAGMAIAGDRLVGYAEFAEHVTDWAWTTHGLTLRVM